MANQQIRKPRLTKKTLRGLATLRAFVEAGDEADIMGYYPNTQEEKEQWDEVVKACKWIANMQTYKEA